MKNQIEIVKEIADSMYGIGGIEMDTNEDFYVEFDMRVRAALGIGIINADVIIGISPCGCTHTQVCRFCASAKEVDWSLIEGESELEAGCVLTYENQNRQPSKSEFLEIIRVQRPDFNAPKNMNAYDLNENGGFKTKK